MIKNTLTVAILICLFLSSYSSFSQVVSRSFEMRYFTDSTIANGTIGFNGDSTFLTSEDRLYYLEKYAEYAKIFFQNTTSGSSTG